MHYSDVIMVTMASQITSLSNVYSNVYSGADQRKYQSSASLAFVRGIHRWPGYSTHKSPVTRKMFPFDDVIISLHIASHVHEQSTAGFTLNPNDWFTATAIVTANSWLLMSGSRMFKKTIYHNPSKSVVCAGACETLQIYYVIHVK